MALNLNGALDMASFVKKNNIVHEIHNMLCTKGIFWPIQFQTRDKFLPFSSIHTYVVLKIYRPCAFI